MLASTVAAVVTVVLVSISLTVIPGAVPLKFSAGTKRSWSVLLIVMALEALAIAHESAFIFDHIRGPMTYEYEWSEMPVYPADDENRRRSRGPFYATLKRIESNKDFFDRAWKVQVRCTAVFGRDHQETFLKMHRARRYIDVAAGMLMNTPNRPGQNDQLWRQLEGDVWAGTGALQPGGDRVGLLLTEFVDEIEALCRPLVDQEYKSAWPTLLEAVALGLPSPLNDFLRMAVAEFGSRKPPAAS